MKVEKEPVLYNFTLEFLDVKNQELLNVIRRVSKKHISAMVAPACLDTKGNAIVAESVRIDYDLSKEDYELEKFLEDEFVGSIIAKFITDNYPDIDNFFLYKLMMNNKIVDGQLSLEFILRGYFGND